MQQRSSHVSIQGVPSGSGSLLSDADMSLLRVDNVRNSQLTGMSAAACSCERSPDLVYRCGGAVILAPVCIERDVCSGEARAAVPRVVYQSTHAGRGIASSPAGAGSAGQ